MKSCLRLNHIFDLSILLAVGVIVRCFRLQQIPAGVFIDNYNLALPALQHHLGLTQIPWFGFNWYGTPELFIRMLEFFQTFVGFETEKIRIIWNFWGFLLIPIIYLIAAKAWGRLAAAMSTLLLIFSVIQINFSRWAHANLVASILIWLGIAFWLAQTKNQRRNILLQIGASVAWAVATYCYVGARTFVAGLVVVALWQLMRAKNKITNYLPFVLGFSFAISPVIYGAYRFPFGFWSRSTELLPFSSNSSLTEKISITLDRLVNHLPLFWQGIDPNLRHNPLQLPHFSIFILLMAVAGFIWLIKIKSFKILQIFVVILVAGWLNSALSQPEISIFRAQPILPAIYLPAGFGFQLISQMFHHKFKINLLISSLLLAMVLLFTPLTQTYFYFFGPQAISPAVSNQHTLFETELARLVRDEVKNFDLIFLAPDYFWFSSNQYELLLANAQNKTYLFDINQIPELDETKSVLIVLPETYKVVAEYLVESWPKAKIEKIRMAQTNIIVIKSAGLNRPQSIIEGSCQSLGGESVNYKLFVPFALWSENQPLPSDEFSCQWWGAITFPGESTYQLTLVADDWAALTLKSDQTKGIIINSTAGESTGIEIEAGQYNFELEYRNDGGAKRLELLVKSLDNDWQIVNPNWL